MRNRIVHLCIALFAVTVFGSLAFVTAQAKESSVSVRAISLQTEPTPVPNDVADMNMSNSSMNHGDMAGMDMSGMDHDMTGHEMTGQDMSGHDMGGHSMAAVPGEGVPPATEAIGAQPLPYELVGDTKVFTLTVQAVQWPIMDGVTMTAYTYNGMVPGPLLRVTEGDKVRVVLQNQLPHATTIHWHGILVPNSMDGIPGVTQEAVQPGETFTYELVAKPSGSFMYHSHTDGDSQVGLGLYAPFIIDPAQPESPAPDLDVILMLSEARVVDGQTYEAMPMAGSEPNYFLLNGKAFPATEIIPVQKGDRVRIRFMGIGQFVHPMHLHGLPFKIVATDGYPVPEAAQLTKDTVLVAPGERYDVEFVATETGQWMLHCHILHHTTNDGVEPGGLMMVLDVTE
jgi:manganese oxidase